MNLKRVLATFLAAAMIAGSAAACSGNSNSNSTPGASSASTPQTTDIVVTYLTLGQTPKDLNMVQDAVNKITVPKIGVSVKFYPIAVSDTFTKYPTLIAGREDIDLMMVAFQNLQSFVNSGSLTTLDDYISKNSDIQEFIKNYSITDGAKINGKTYGVSVTNPLGFQGSVMVSNKYLKDINLTVDANKIYSFDDLTKIFALIKKADPKKYPCGILGSNLSGGNSGFQFMHVIDTLGSSSASGVLMDTGSTKVVDMYETKEYYDFLKTVKSWYSAGYIMPDAATNDTASATLMRTGVLASELMSDKPAAFSGAQTGLLGGATALHTTEIYRPAASSSTGTFWTVPSYSTKAEAALKFLGLTLADNDLSNLIQWGIEGTHYKMIDKANGIIDFANGLNETTSGYFNGLGLWGNQNDLYSFSKFCDKAINEAYVTKSKANPTKAVGYQYDSSKMSNQIVAVNAVLNQYLPTLETGSEKDLDKTYDAFVKALKAANIDAIIADNQKQFDSWSASK